MILDDYLGLITSEFRNQPNFIATLTAVGDLFVHIQDVITSMVPKYDVDVAVGAQLDVIGLWVGISRNVTIPIDGVYFSWDGDYTVGWDYGVWQATISPTSVTVLPDDIYRTLIKAKIAANSWDGTTDGAYAIWEQVFSNFEILIQDYQNMSYDLAIVGGIVDSLTLALIASGAIPLKPEGVRVNRYIVPVDTNPLFAWNIENDLLAGWNEGSWGREIKPT